MRRDEGFTLIEVLTVMAITAILLTLSASAVRHYWLQRQLTGSADEVVSQLRQLQVLSTSQSHPLVYGARFVVGDSDFSLVRYDPKSPSTSDDDVCSQIGTRSLEGAVRVTSVSFQPAPGVTSLCSAAFPGSVGSEFVFFYAKGTATQGEVKVALEAIGRSRTVAVTPITGRVQLQ
jgi:prepilin-type N-terminal cleavage/methylation domain-containing protein